MIIPKEEVERAKEKLGEKNFDLIMDGLINRGLIAEEDIDRKNMRCKCPFHGDVNPSFSFDKKLNRMYCFGCNRSYDIIDSFKDDGLTYLEAVQHLFELTNIQFAFSEKNIKMQPREYRYPKEPNRDTDMTSVIEYWRKRGISEDTLRYADVRADEHGNSAFLSFDDNDVLTVVKYKPSHKIDKASNEPKTWFQKDSDAADILFNMNRINTLEPLLVVEGEPDCLTAIEAGYKNVVSPLKGAGSFGWIEKTWQFLDQFDTIIICSDNDPAGEKMRNELVYRLGTYRTKCVDIPTKITWKDGKEYPCNDLNDFLLTCGKEAVLDAIIHASDSPITSVIDYADVEGINLSDMDGVETGLEALDSEIYKLYYGTLTILTGRPGAGKSSIINTIVASALQNDVPCWLFSKEMPAWIIRQWMDLQFAGPRNVEQKSDRKGRVYYNVKPGVKSKINNWVRGNLFLYKDGEPNDADSIFNSMEAAVRKLGAHLLIIDNLLCVQLSSPEGELKAQTDFIARLIDFAIKYNVAIILAAHPRKRSSTDPVNADLTMDDIAGSMSITALAHRSIALRRVTKKEQEDSTNPYCNYNVKVTITKDRLLGRTDTSFGLFYDIPTRRFFSDYDEYARNYSWDKTKYEDKLPVPMCIQQEEAMRSIDQEADREVFGA